MEQRARRAVGSAWAGLVLSAALPPAASAAALPERAPDHFPIEAYDVAGVSRLTSDDIAAAVYPFSGPDRTQDDVEKARKAVQDAYAARGFDAVVVDIPMQPQETFARGIVEITVNEAPVGQVRVSGARFHALSIVRDQVPSLVPGQPVDFKALQSDLAAANRFPDRSINPTFKAGAVPGTVDVDLKVDDQRPLHASVEISNDHSPSTEPLRVTGAVRYTNLWQAGQTAAFTYIVAPQKRSDTEVFAGSYTIPFLSSPWTLALSGYKSNSDIAALAGSSVLGDGYQVGFRVLYRLPADRTVQTLSIGADYKDFKQDISLAGVLATRAPIEYVPIEAQYAVAGATDHTSFGVTATITAGLRAIKKARLEDCPTATGSTEPCYVDQFQNREQNSNENFVHANLTLDYSMTFLQDFVTTARLAAQVADSHLVTNEQFAAGGLLSVRGYLQSEAVGDDGVSGGLELRSPSFASWFGKAVTEARLYGFVDAAYLRVLSPLKEQADSYTLASIGLGARARLINLLTGELLVGLPLRSGPYSKAGDPRITFVAKGEF